MTDGVNPVEVVTVVIVTVVEVLVEFVWVKPTTVILSEWPNFVLVLNFRTVP